MCVLLVVDVVQRHALLLIYLLTHTHTFASYLTLNCVINTYI